MATARGDLPGRIAQLRLGGTLYGIARQLASSAGLRSSSGTIPGWAIVSAGMSPIVMTAAWLIADTLQPASYSPVRQTVSVLAGQAGTDRWIVTGALLVVGGCHLLTAAGLTGVGTPARLLLVVAGLSSIGIAVSPEPAGGSTPQHIAWTSLGALVIAIWPAFTGRHGAQWPLVLSGRGAAAVTAAFAVLLLWLLIETQGGSVLGLAERLASTVQMSWPFVIALALRRVGAAPLALLAGEPEPPGGPLRAQHPAAGGTLEAPAAPGVLEKLPR
jgi:hypothetical protein